MMASRHDETRAGLAPRRVSELDHAACLIGSERNPDRLNRQAQRIAEQYALSIPHAKAVAEIAFSTGRARA